jgi:3-hydroxyacyl-[acyl-carrier-protein] dehydratase
VSAPARPENPTWRAELSVRADHPALPGHFPSEPVVPGVLLLDEVLHLLSGEAGRWRVEQVKFHHVVRPGEPLTLLVRRRAEGSYAFEVLSERQIVSTGLLLPETNAPGVPSLRP